MVVLVDQIREGGLHLDQPFGQEQVARALQEGGDTGFRAARGFQLEVDLQKVASGVVVRGSFEAEVVAPCKRCLKEVAVALPVSFTLNLVDEQLANDAGLDGEEGGAAEPAGSFTLDDADEEVFDGKTIDLDPIVREQVLLALPMYALCSEDCKGLCPVCGQDLNQQACACEKRPVDPRLAALKTIKLN
jgi:uncharacterized protein